MNTVESLESQLYLTMAQGRKKSLIVLKVDKQRSAMSNLLLQLDALESIVQPEALDTLKNTVISAVLEATLVGKKGGDKIHRPVASSREQRKKHYRVRGRE